MQENQKMTLKEKLMSFGQRLGKAIMLPIAILPGAGLLLGISAALTNPATVKAYPFLNNVLLQSILKVMNAAGSGIFGALALVFAVGIGVGLARSDKGTAGLAAVVGFFTMNATINALLAVSGKLAPAGADLRAFGQANVLGTVSLQMGIFGGILVGLMTAWLHNRYYKQQLPTYLAFFGGSRFVPIVAALSSMILGTILFMVWPLFGQGIKTMGSIVDATGVFGTFAYALVNRLLLPLGLHHVWYLPFWTTAVGGTMEVAGKVYEGTQTIFMAQLGSSDTIKFYEGTARFMGGRYFHMMFGLPAVALAMYHAIPDAKRRKATLGFLFSAGLTSFITGVTEPIDFALLFASPVLYVASCIFFALDFVIAHILSITIGSTFSAGIIEFLLFGVMQGEPKTNWIWVVIMGAPVAIVYYFTFKTLILKFNYATPGRELEEASETEMAFVSEADTKMAGSCREETIIIGLGGKNNIVELDNCATRLRVTIKDPSLVDAKILKTTGALNTLIRGKSLQIIYGPAVNIIKIEVEEYMEKVK